MTESEHASDHSVSRASVCVDNSINMPESRSRRSTFAQTARAMSAVPPYRLRCAPVRPSLRVTVDGIHPPLTAETAPGTGLSTRTGAAATKVSAAGAGLGDALLSIAELVAFERRMVALILTTQSVFGSVLPAPTGLFAVGDASPSSAAAAVTLSSRPAVSPRTVYL